MTRGLSWTSYAMGGALAIILSWIMTGCRLGNHTEPAPGKPADTMSGFYSSDLSKHELCVTLMDDTKTCGLATAAEVPNPYAKYIHNPFAFLLQDTGTGESFIVNPWVDKTTGIGVTAQQSNKSFIHVEADSGTIWDNKCNVTTQVSLVGSLNGTDSGSVLSGQKLSGHAEIKVIDSTLFDSATCGDALKSMYSCYVDETLCEGQSKEDNQQLHDTLHAIFKTYTDHGILIDKDIPFLKKLVFELNYL